MFVKIILVFICIKFNLSYAEYFYNLTDHIEEFSDDNFESKILNSKKITWIEFYATWCGWSQAFKPHWKEFASETLGWHKNVLRVGAMNCFYKETIINRVCHKMNLSVYPVFKLYHAKTHRLEGIDKESEESRSEQFMKATIDFIEHQRHPPREWPSLYPYTYEIKKKLV
jgi:hypothetical protein